MLLIILTSIKACKIKAQCEGRGTEDWRELGKGVIEGLKERELRERKGTGLVLQI